MRFCWTTATAAVAALLLAGCGSRSEEKQLAALKAKATASAREVEELKAQVDQLSKENEALKRLVAAASLGPGAATQNWAGTEASRTAKPDPVNPDNAGPESALLNVMLTARRHARSTEVKDYNYWDLTAQQFVDEIAPKLAGTELTFEGKMTYQPAATRGLYLIRPVMHLRGAAKAGAAEPGLRVRFMEFLARLPGQLLVEAPTEASIAIRCPVQWAIAYVREKTLVKKFYQQPGGGVNCVAAFSGLDFGDYGEAVRCYVCADPKTVKVVVEGKFTIDYQPLEGGNKDVLKTKKEASF